MSWWLPLALLAIFVLLLAAMPWKRPHPNHVFTVEMLERLADSEAVCEPNSTSGLRETVSADNDNDGASLEAATAPMKPAR